MTRSSLTHRAAPFFVILLIGIVILVLGMANNLSQNLVTTPRKAAETVTWTALTDDFESDLIKWPDRQGQVVLSAERARTGTKSIKIQTTGPDAYAAHTFTENHNLSKPYVFVYDDGIVTADARYAFFEASNPTTGKKISVGIQTNKNVYIYCPTGDKTLCIDTPITRTVGWRRLIFFITPKGAYAKIDGRVLSDLPSVTNHPDVSAVNPDLTASLKIRLLVSGTNAAFYFDDLGEYVVASMPDLAGLLNRTIGVYINTYGNITETYMSQISQSILDQHSHFCSVSTFPCPTANRHDYNGRTYLQYEAQRNLTVNNFRDLAGILRSTGLQENINKADIIDRVFHERGLIHSQGRLYAAQPGQTGNVLGVSDAAITDKDKSEGVDIAAPSTQEQATSYVGTFNPAGPWWCNPGRPYSEFISNSSGEENSWPATGLDGVYITGLDGAGHPLSQAEREDALAQAKLFAFHSFSRGESTPQVTTSLHTYPAYTSRTIYDDYSFDNHAYHPNPTYALSTVQDLLTMAYNHKSLYGTIPPEFLHNVREVFQKAEQYVDFRNFQYKGDLIERNQRDRDNNNISDYGVLHPETDPTCTNPPANFANDGTRLPGNIFLETGRDDWGVDALFRRLTMYALVKDILGLNSYSDPQTGFSTNDLATHAVEYFGYIHQEYLFRWEPPQVQFTTMEIPAPGSPINNSMYRWMRNTQVIGDITRFIDVTEHRPPIVTATPVPLQPTLTPEPTHPAGPTLTPGAPHTIEVSFAPCIPAGTTTLVKISWHVAFDPTWVDITEQQSFLFGFHTKFIRSLVGTYAPEGFNGNLKLQQGKEYKVRVRRGFNLSPVTTFRVPDCSATH